METKSRNVKFAAARGGGVMSGADMKATTALSSGHICFAFDGTVEFIEVFGQVYRAPISDAFDLDGNRHGRWECSRSHFDRFRDVLGATETEVARISIAKVTP